MFWGELAMIRVLIADDSSLTRAILAEIFAASGDICVAGEAVNGQEALRETERLKPDLIVMDLLMPVMDGLSAIEEIMARCPTPILVLSATLEDQEVDRAFAAIKRGALDVLPKPSASELALPEGFAAALLDKVRLLSRIRVIRHPLRLRKEVPVEPAHGGYRNILAIGASTGGPKAVLGIVRSLPSAFPGVVFVVQHIASGFAKGFADWINRESRMRVKLAEDGEECRPGVAYVAPNDCHMEVAGGRVRLLTAEPVNNCIPSIDVLFRSLAAESGSHVVGVLLTGMGRDGAQGLKCIKERGGTTIVQDEQSCVVFGMPKAAIGLAAADQVLPLDSIPAAVQKLFTK